MITQKWFKRKKLYGDPLGQALLDYARGTRDELILIYSDVTEYEPMNPAYFFRRLSEMPQIEQQAIALCSGRVLDVGSGAGSHALELMKAGMEVKGVDVSPGAAAVAQSRGFSNIHLCDFFEVSGEQFDTILLMMNGLGIAGRLKKLPEFLRKCHSLLPEGGQILLDSADLMHLFVEEDGSIMMNMSVEYYGEVRYQMEYKGIVGRPFDWLYVDYLTLQSISADCGLTAELIMEDDSHAYLARLVKQS